MTQIIHDKVAIDDASDDQLRSFATGYLQLELDDKVKTRAQIIAAIDKAWKNPFVLVQQGLQPVSTQAQAPEPKAQFIGFLAKYRDDPPVELTIGKTGYPGGDKPVPVNVNGGNIVIPRGRAYVIPYRFYLALCNAHSVDVTQDPKTMELQFNQTTNYPLQNIKLPPQADIDAWHKKFDSIPLGGVSKAKKAA